MLKDKDKIILDHLFAYSRFTSKQLSKITNLTQQAVHYKIKKLEEEGYILRYDAIINWNVIPLIKEIIYIRAKDPNKTLNELKKNLSVFSINQVVGDYNLVVWCFFKNKWQQIELKNKLKDYKWESLESKEAIFPNMSIFNSAIRLDVPKANEGVFKLDKIDIKIMKFLAEGNARESVREIGDKLDIHYDIVYYRLKKLIKSGYFFKLMAQVGFNSLELKLSMLLIEVKKGSKIDELVSNLQKTGFLTIMVTNKTEKIHINLFSANIEDYWDKVEKIISILGNDFIGIKNLHIKSTPLLNRYPLEFLLRS